MELGCLSLIIGSADSSVEIVMLRAVGVESAEILVGLKTIGVSASLAWILIGVIAIKGIVIDYKSEDGYKASLRKIT